jgi:hypothetical protein
MNSELVIASIKPYLKEWKARGNDTRFLYTKIRKGRAKGSDDAATELAYLLAEASMNSGSSVGDPELQNKYNELLKAKTLLENDLIDLRNEMKEKDADIKEREYMCSMNVSNTNKENKILRQKLDNVINSWINDGGEENGIYKIINKGLQCVADMEFGKVDDGYNPYPDEGTNQ